MEVAGGNGSALRLHPFELPTFDLHILYDNVLTRGAALTAIRPHDVATYIETRGLTHSAPDVKQQLAAVRMLFDWLITGQMLPINPAAAVRGPKHVVKTGKTAVLDAKEWRTLIDSIPTDTLRDRRDRALI